MAPSPGSALPSTERFLEFWRERHLCTVTTLRPDGTPHVVPMGFVIDPDTGTAWAITSGTSRKVANIRSAGPEGALIAVCQVDGRWWSTLEGRVQVREDAASVAEAVARYTERYRVPRENPERVALHVQVTRVLGNVG
ncbi:pyridoxamine 5'-phosphate oxidase family protein [Nocardioides mesophilus]|uniref:TIGR03618 family F420-dependent PPOX class oxidoreductase n=1 Tax=Nocardioides mesophilus TaxID=433659 RepID=A0A7G9R6V3_9ACTN|nr:TIGR03618 family F420-dependent PPOX class oxidoreductase [Nocardioides mesophilus]QNN51328.1 TIGR03618 family F420-dependent PPOX class oxidoreductase [Nocardioides mesophilus]